MKNKENKLSKKGKLMLLLVCILGFILGFVSSLNNIKFNILFSNISLQNIPNSIIHLIILIIYVQLLFLILKYNSIKKILKKDINSLTEEEYLVVNKEIDKASYFISLASILHIVLYGIISGNTVCKLLVVLSIIIYSAFHIVISEAYKTIHPKQNILIPDSDSFVNNLDEIQQQILGKVCTKTYLFIEFFLTILLVIFAIFTLTLKISYGYLLLIAFIKIVVVTASAYFDIKIEHKK